MNVQRTMRAFCAVLMSAFLASAAHASVTVTETAVWEEFSSVRAKGSLGGIEIRARTTPSSEFVGFSGNHFAEFDGECGEWDGMSFLDHSVQGLVTSNVNAGDFQEFSFSSPLTNGLFYVENFDSNSMAMLTATGATSITVVDASSSISYDSTGADTGKLSTSNSGFDGEGDVIFLIEGDVSNIRLDYTGGDGANGILYTFANGTACPVPEPTSLLVMAGLFSLGGFAVYRRRDAQN